MSLLTRLGRAAGENRQVNIFGAHEDTQDMAAERSYQEVKQRIHQRIVDEMTPEEQLMLTSVHQDPHQVETLITDYCQRVLDENPFAIPQGEKPRLIADIRDEVLGLGPIEALRKDDAITEIMVNGPRQVFVERMGKLELTDAKFHDTAHLMNIIERILTPLGRRVDESSPLVDARLEDGSRVNIIIPPLSLVGPCLTIRKFSKTPLSVDNLISFGTMDEKMATCLRACVKQGISHPRLVRAELVDLQDRIGRLVVALHQPLRLLLSELFYKQRGKRLRMAVAGRCVLRQRQRMRPQHRAQDAVDQPRGAGVRKTLGLLHRLVYGGRGRNFVGKFKLIDGKAQNIADNGLQFPTCKGVDPTVEQNAVLQHAVAKPACQRRFAAIHAGKPLLECAVRPCSAPAAVRQGKQRGVSCTIYHITIQSGARGNNRVRASFCRRRLAGR